MRRPSRPSRRRLEWRATKSDGPFARENSRIMVVRRERFVKERSASKHEHETHGTEREHDQ